MNRIVCQGHAYVDSHGGGRKKPALPPSATEHKSSDVAKTWQMFHLTQFYTNLTTLYPITLYKISDHFVPLYFINDV